MRNPTRRNRNIGTAKSGLGQDNRLTIPRPHHGDNIYWERIENASQLIREISGRTVLFFVQPTLEDFIHPCTIDDIAHVLSHVRPDDCEGLDAIVLRQPRRKEKTISPVWGRLAYSADLVNARGAVLYQGPAILLEAQKPRAAWEFTKGPGPDIQDEIDRLQRDGHLLRVEHRRYIFESTLDACRATQLYRTLLHEIGHWVDYLEKVQHPSNESNWDQLWDLYHQRSSLEKESFAHRYADGIAAMLRDQRIIPFDRIVNFDSLAHNGLRFSDFVPPEM